MAVLENIIYENMDFPVEVFIQDTARTEVQVKEHWHNYFEFLFLQEGGARHIINGREYHVGPRKMVILLNGDIHGIYCDEGIRTKIYVVKFIPSMIHPKYKSVYQSKYLPAFMMQAEPVPVLSELQADELERQFIRMETEMERKERGYEYIIRGYILQFIGYLLREKIIRFEAEAGTEKEQENIGYIVKYIEDNYAFDINLSKIAESLHMNYYYASKYFKKLTGKNFKQFLDFVRVSEANKLLVESNKSITEIASLCGFSCPQSMSRTYKRVMGKSPTGMR